MLLLLKRFLLIALLAGTASAAWAYSLSGPVANSPEDSFQVTEIGYNPLGLGNAPPFFIDGLRIGPKNLGEGYRLNTPVLYYAFDPSFGYFGSDGETAVQKAYDILNSLTNVDNYSTNLSEFPLRSQSVNYQAAMLGLQDVKSETLAIMMGQMGLADSVRYVWALTDRDNPAGSMCPQGGPSIGYTYVVIQRNYDVTATPLNFNAPDVGQYSPYVNGELYSYFIFDDCDAPAASPPTADALEIPVDPLHNNPPVASGVGEDQLTVGSFYTGLTRDDVAGLRYLMSSNNVFAPSAGYLETSAGGSQVTGGGGSSNTNKLTTSSLSTLNTDPTTLQALYPGIVINSVTTNVVNGATNYVYAFGNVVTNVFSPTSSAQILTTNVAPPIGAPIGSPNVTNVSLSKPFQTNLVSGDFYIVPTNSCGIEVLSTNFTTISFSTNLLVVGTNSTGNFFSQSLVTKFTAYNLNVIICTSSSGTNANTVVADFQGIGKVQFVRVPDANYDYQTGLFYSPITNKYSMVAVNNGQLSTVTFQRVVIRPDYLFEGQNLSSGGNDVIYQNPAISVSTPNFINGRNAAIYSGPGIIDPTSSTNTVIVFSTVGPYYNNSSPAFLSGPNAAISRSFIWGSFDGTTNAPIVYPNGTSIATLAAESLFQISPTALPNASHASSSYTVTLTVSGGQPPYSWSLASGTVLPAGWTLSAGGVISGSPSSTPVGTYDLVVQLNDSGGHVVRNNYALVITN
jgi:Putative Ig domain